MRIFSSTQGSEQEPADGVCCQEVVLHAWQLGTDWEATSHQLHTVEWKRYPQHCTRSPRGLHRQITFIYLRTTQGGELQAVEMLLVLLVTAPALLIGVIAGWKSSLV